MRPNWPLASRAGRRAKADGPISSIGSIPLESLRRGRAAVAFRRADRHLGEIGLRAPPPPSTRPANKIFRIRTCRRATGGSSPPQLPPSLQPTHSPPSALTSAGASGTHRPWARRMLPEHARAPVRPATDPLHHVREYRDAVVLLLQLPVDGACTYARPLFGTGTCPHTATPRQKAPCVPVHAAAPSAGRGCGGQGGGSDP